MPLHFVRQIYKVYDVDEARFQSILSSNMIFKDRSIVASIVLVNGIVSECNVVNHDDVTIKLVSFFQERLTRLRRLF